MGSLGVAGERIPRSVSLAWAPLRWLDATRARPCAGVLLGALLLGTALNARAESFEVTAERYRPYMIKDIDQALAGARTLHDCAAAKDLAGARKAWISARIGWERAEVFTSGFVPDLDREIDAWPNAMLGFHAIEAKLFGAGRTDVQQETEALILHLEDLDVKIKRIQLLPQRLLNGAARLAYEVGENKADGGESRFAGTSLDDMRNNVAGIGLAYDVIFKSFVRSADTALAGATERSLRQLTALLAVEDLKNLDPVKLRASSEELVVDLQKAGPKIGLRAPTLEDIMQ
jgi:iron uptake system component EfeO